MARTPRQQDERMPEPAAAVMTRTEPQPDARSAAPPDDPQGRVAELRVSGHLMTLDTGLFCVFQAPGSPPPDATSGLPGVRISLAPGLAGRPDAVDISTFRQDGWLNGTAALVRVSQGPAQILVTIYQAPRQGPEAAPRLQVLRLSNGQTAAPAAAPAAMPAAALAPTAAAVEHEIVAHVQRTGDVGARVGDWIGTRGSKSWIEGFAIKPSGGLAAEDIEYQAVLGRGWQSPWVEGGKFCGSRGMALPLLGLRVRLKGAAARQWECSYEATFTDGSAIGPVGVDQPCEAESLASLEAFRVELRRRDDAGERDAAASKPHRTGRSGTRGTRSAGPR
jgi:hypothetical protein